MKSMQLFCLPYAGGSAFMYYSLGKELDDRIEHIQIDYAGHGERISEEFYTDFTGMVNDVASIIIKQLEDIPFAILGYSMGSLVAFEVYYEIMKRTGKRPDHLFFAAHAAPQLHQGREYSYEASINKLKLNLAKMGGSAIEALQHEELLDMVVPVFHTDLNLYSDYKYMNKEHALLSNVTIIYSDDENVDNTITEWSKYTTRHCTYCKMEGNHFFIHSQMTQMSRIINRTLITELSFY